MHATLSDSSESPSDIIIIYAHPLHRFTYATAPSSPFHIRHPLHRLIYATAPSSPFHIRHPLHRLIYATAPSSAFHIRHPLHRFIYVTLFTLPSSGPLIPFTVSYMPLSSPSHLSKSLHPIFSLFPPNSFQKSSPARPNPYSLCNSADISQQAHGIFVRLAR
jgi:hypothetical protein